jgi:glucose-6-phosphate-specific signal transduction histidine kinase
LVVAEFLPLAYLGYDCADQFGVAWAFAVAIPPILVSMPLGWWFRSRMVLFPAQRDVNVSVLVLFAFLTSLLWGLGSFITLALAHDPMASAAVNSVGFFRYFLGNFLGALTVAPLVLMIRGVLREPATGSIKKSLTESRLLLDSVGLLLPALGLLIWVGVHTTGDIRQVSRIAAFLPVAWLTLRHGWRGAALGGAAASVAIMFTMVSKREPALIQAQAFMAFAIMSLMMLGARIAVLNERERQERIEGKLALQLAQQGLYRSELRMRQVALALEQIGEAMQQAHQRLLERFRHLLPATEERVHSRQAVLTQQQVYRLANSLYPRVWAQNDLPMALRNGSIADALTTIGATYHCSTQGVCLNKLAPGVQMMLYRLACEVVAYLASQQAYAQVCLTSRSGVRRGRYWVALRVRGLGGDDNVRWSLQDLELLRSRMGAEGLPLWTLRDQTRIYEGAMHLRKDAGGWRVTLLLQDVIA